MQKESSVLEDNLGDFIEKNRKYNITDSFVQAHSSEGIPNFFLLWPKYKKETRTGIVKTIFEEMEEKQIRYAPNSLVFELLFCNLFNKTDQECIPVWIGGNENNDICIPSGYISAWHGYFVLNKQNGSYVLVYADNESSNGSYIDRVLIKPKNEVRVSSRAVVSLGHKSAMINLVVFSLEDMYKTVVNPTQ